MWQRGDPSSPAPSLPLPAWPPAPLTYGPECTRMEPTLSTPASFRLGQAPLSSWQRPWKFSCSKMAIWKRAGPQHGGHPGPAPLRGAHAVPGHWHSTSAAAQTSHSPKTALQRILVQATAPIHLRMQLSLTGALPALSKCPGAPGRGMPMLTAGIKQLPGDLGCGWSTAATSGTLRPRHPGTARGQPQGCQLSTDLRGQRAVGTDLLCLQRWWEIST